jgi:hypothetical protein
MQDIYNFSVPRFFFARKGYALPLLTEANAAGPF